MNTSHSYNQGQSEKIISRHTQQNTNKMTNKKDKRNKLISALN